MKKLKVSRNCHVKYQNMNYSVPYQYVQQYVIAKLSEDEIEICDQNNKTICSHRLGSIGHGNYVTVASHLPSTHQEARAISKQGLDYFLEQAKRIGPGMRNYIWAVSKQSQHVEQSYNSLQAILHCGKGIPHQAVNQLAEDLLDRGEIGYGKFTKAMKKLREKYGSAQTQKHSNLRGKDYYK
ncbi:Mu transposase domain-containing protein [Ileibacterium valens]|uniref:Mu transposase domain-containing protein n=1 Tax=Ileibacterium valens TaxID=1862668 RepID=UPI002572F4A2|nr:hypothetical protein [Ileibacterium valens]